MKHSQHISEFLWLLSHAQQDYNIALSNLKEQEQLTQDIEHSLELDELGYHERAKLATLLRDNRQERRQYKDAIEELSPVCDFVEANKKVIHDLERLLGAVRKQEKYHENRTYVPRILKREGE